MTPDQPCPELDSILGFFPSRPDIPRSQSRQATMALAVKLLGTCSAARFVSLLFRRTTCFAFPCSVYSMMDGPPDADLLFPLPVDACFMPCFSYFPCFLHPLGDYFRTCSSRFPAMGGCSDSASLLCPYMIHPKGVSKIALYYIEFQTNEIHCSKKVQAVVPVVCRHGELTS